MKFLKCIFGVPFLLFATLVVFASCDLHNNTAIEDIHWIYYSIVALLAGVVILLICVVILIKRLNNKTHSEKQKLEELVAKRTHELELESTLLNTVFDTIPDLLFCKNLKHELIRVNQSYADLFALNRDSLIGKTEREALNLTADITQLWNEWDTKVTSEKITLTIEDRIPFDNSIRIFETIKTPLIQDGKSLGLLGLSRDVTRRKELEEEIITTSKAKTAFIANMSHEIRTPMNSIVGFSELALEEEMSEKAREYLKRIIENSNGLLQIINDILDISKIESGKLELESIPFRLDDVFAQCQSAVLPKAIKKGIKLHFSTNPCPENTLLLGDPLRINQIFTNLVGNAVKFTNHGAIDIVTDIVDITETTQTIYFEVRDSGIGMSPEQMAYATEPFAQADLSITRKYGGTGLGLPIVSNFVEMMGGNLQIESTLGIGSKFSFKLTFNTIEITSDTHQQSVFISETQKPIFDGEILVCEDNPMNQMVIIDHLERIGLRCHIAANGKMGVDMVKQRIQTKQPPFSLIFMDIHMPIMDGLEAAEQINALCTGIPIVALTANVMVADKDSYRQHGMMECVGKPFTSHDLWGCLLKYMTPLNWVGKDYEIDEQDDELLTKLRVSFVKDNKNRFFEIREAIESNDWEQAYRLVHTLKSSAGLIGKTRLQDIATAIERRLKEGINYVTESSWLVLDRELKYVLNEFLPLLAEVESKEKASDVLKDPKEILELAEQLDMLLKIRSPRSLELLDHIRAIPGTAKLASQIEGYEFKAAIETLNEFKKTWR